MKTFIKENATKIIFMAAVFSFLGVSVPKVASVFHIFEPDGVMWWIFAYLAAAGIDVLAGYLTLVMMNKETRTRDKIIIWTFIIALMGYSWYCNWLFNLINNPQPGNYWTIHPLGLPVTLRDLTPIIISALPIFVVAYASIAHLVHVKVEPISLEELQRQATEAQERALAKVAILDAQNMVNEKRAAGVASLGRSVWKNTFSSGQAAAQGDQVKQSTEQSAPSVEQRIEKQGGASSPALPAPPDQHMSPEQRTEHDTGEHEAIERAPAQLRAVPDARERVRRAMLSNPGASDRELARIAQLGSGNTAKRHREAIEQECVS
jgi:hypothetical protein